MEEHVVTADPHQYDPSLSAAEFRFSSSSFRWAAEAVDSKVHEWRDLMVERAAADPELPTEVEVFPIGAMKSGHFTGPKPRAHSLNPECPFDNVIEADVRIVIPEGFSPHDDRIVRLITNVVQPDHMSEKLIVPRWHSEIETVYMYRYEPLGEGLGFEWEVSVNSKPYVEIAHVWNRVFTPEEVAWQTDLREHLRKMGVDLSAEFNPMKNMQCTECRWRIVASYALEQSGEFKGELDLPFQGDPPPLLEPLVEMWLSGVSGVNSLDRPSHSMRKPTEEKICRHYPPEVAARLVAGIREPEWVSVARDYQDQIRRAQRAFQF